MAPDRLMLKIKLNIQNTKNMTASSRVKIAIYVACALIAGCANSQPKSLVFVPITKKQEVRARNLVSSMFESNPEVHYHLIAGIGFIEELHVVNYRPLASAQANSKSSVLRILVEYKVKRYKVIFGKQTLSSNRLISKTLDIPLNGIKADNL